MFSEKQKLREHYKYTNSIKDYPRSSIDVEITSLPAQYWDITINSSEIFTNSELSKDDMKVIARLKQYGKVNNKALEDLLYEFRNFMLDINGATVRELITRPDVYLCGMHGPFVGMFGEVFIHYKNFSVSIMKGKKNYYQVIPYLHTLQENNFIVDIFLGGNEKVKELGEIPVSEVLSLLGGASYEVLETILNSNYVNNNFSS